MYTLIYITNRSVSLKKNMGFLAYIIKQQATNNLVLYSCFLVIRIVLATDKFVLYSCSLVVRMVKAIGGESIQTQKTTRVALWQ